MRLLEFDAPRGIFGTDLRIRIKRSLGRSFRAMQFARMVQCMRQMSDEQLKSIGLTRADIPRYARQCIYEDQA